jgi:predicted unusual protein kinase regulating ubiquinone biosynthesis (AarF/ABC1/UbiB family)
MSQMDGLTIPRTHPSHCTARVLTMDRLVGESADDFVAHASDAARQRAGDIIANTFYDMVYRLRTLHADPHGGNYLFRPDGTVGLIDFGCVKRLDLYWIADYARMALACIDDDRENMMVHCVKIGILAERNPAAEDVLWRVGRIICGPLLVDHYACGGPQDDVASRLAAIAPTILLHPALRSPPELVYLHRALGGIYALLRKLGHRHNYRALFRPYAIHSIAVAEGRKEDGSPVLD